MDGCMLGKCVVMTLAVDDDDDDDIVGPGVMNDAWSQMAPSNDKLTMQY